MFSIGCVVANFAITDFVPSTPFKNIFQLFELSLHYGYSIISQCPDLLEPTRIIKPFSFNVAILENPV